MSVGSINHKPPLPVGEAAVTAIPFVFTLCPDVSTNPPSPDFAPPLAEMLAATFVSLSDHMMTLPPLPVSFASALISTFSEIVVVLAL